MKINHLPKNNRLKNVYRRAEAGSNVISALPLSGIFEIAH